eukprot:1511752-Pleurochrysis_carterae.AAC.1
MRTGSRSPAPPPRDPALAPSFRAIRHPRRGGARARLLNSEALMSTSVLSTLICRPLVSDLVVFSSGLAS